MFSWHVRFRDSNDDLTAVPLFVYVGSFLLCVDSILSQVLVTRQEQWPPTATNYILTLVFYRKGVPLFLNTHISNLREDSDWPCLDYESITKGERHTSLVE